MEEISRQKPGVGHQMSGATFTASVPCPERDTSWRFSRFTENQLQVTESWITRSEVHRGDTDAEGTCGERQSDTSCQDGGCVEGASASSGLEEGPV